MDSYWEHYPEPRKPKAFLDDWSITSGRSNPYQAPETVPIYLNGTVFGHDRIDNGTFITTSLVLNVDYSNQPVTIETKHTYYELGEPDQAYRQWCDKKGHDVFFWK